MDYTMVELAQSAFAKDRTLMLELPTGNHNQTFTIGPCPKDIAVVVPRRWKWLERVFGQRIIILKSGLVLEAYANGSKWDVSYAVGPLEKTER